MRQTDQCFGLLDMLMSKEELAIQVGEIDGVKVDDVDLAEACKHEVLEQLTSNASGTNHEHTGLSDQG
jgi:hypothetical protein